MKIPRTLLIAALLLAVLVGAALAQTFPTLFVTSPTGAEQVCITTTGPQIACVRIAQLRDSAGYTKLVPTTGQTLQFPNNASVMQLTPAGGLAALTVLTPTTPYDGQRLQVFTTQTITTFNLTATAGQTVNGNLAGALSANGNVEYVYSTSNTTWDRIQ